MSQLKILIEKLSKSSPEAVNTLNFDSSLFEYLHVVTKVEEKYLETLESNLNKKCIIFLSGSSGDGKSAIINKYISKYSPNYDFHVDATHSFAPKQTSIQALDDSFDKYKNDDKSLVVGINIGIMINYLYDGSETHSDIQIS
ncbi:MAG: DNA phosphorothioation-dependent restriction protein DptF [Sulfurimonas sp.]|uniref:DNA phosphorothioation-dependent restriction protein DptF n=1 Tax=Sulfurimonas sp. TaxID=2022749 RepID=UPI002602FD7D|nr:DNA phosphorothioation-dependent restriction protein DptF [Sulfurimonas sp.]MDD2653301.1 DNA phosphorothioation-dependent restriction protein DptF [Sulfurimonas sp.]MDD3451232.1 DNA phosphorothioation-dependent restriction protein DptF [Sulfurimonas sp.]